MNNIVKTVEMFPLSSISLRQEKNTVIYVKNNDLVFLDCECISVIQVPNTSLTSVLFSHSFLQFCQDVKSCFLSQKKDKPMDKILYSETIL